MGADFICYMLMWDADKKVLDFDGAREFVKSGLDRGDLTTEVVNEDVILSDIDSIEKAIYRGTRECDERRIGHLKILLTGGMSWGDGPTDLARSISNLEDFHEGRILDIIGFIYDDTDYRGILKRMLRRLWLPVNKVFAKRDIKTVQRLMPKQSTK